MNKLSSASKPTFTVRYLQGQRCLCLSSYTVSSRFVIRDLKIDLDHEYGDDISKGKLRSLDAMFTRDHMNQKLASVLDTVESKTSDVISCWIVKGEMLWRVKRGHCVLGISWGIEPFQNSLLKFSLKRIVLFGDTSESALDLGYYFIDFVIDTMNDNLNDSIKIFSFKDNRLYCHVARLLLNPVFTKIGLGMPDTENGVSDIHFVDGDVSFKFDSDPKLVKRDDRTPWSGKMTILEWKSGSGASEGEAEDSEEPMNSKRPTNPEVKLLMGDVFNVTDEVIDNGFSSSLEYVPESVHTGVVIKPLSMDMSDHTGFSAIFPQIQRMASVPEELNSGIRGVEAVESDGVCGEQAREGVDREVPREEVEACGKSGSVDGKRASEEGEEKRGEYEYISRLHEVMHAGGHIGLELAQGALSEAKRHFLAPLYLGLIYVIHKYEPALDDGLKLSALCAESSDNDTLLMEVLEDVYKRDENYTLLVDLYRHAIQLYDGCPHATIRVGIACANTLSQNLGYCSAAIKRLDGMKTLIQMNALPEEKLEFAKAYHHAQGTSMAIHLLKQFMQHTTEPEETALYGYAIVCMMQEHNEPGHAIINASMSVLDAVPNHREALNVLVYYLEKCGRYEDAAYYGEQLLDLREHDLEMIRAKARLDIASDLEAEVEACRQNAIDIVTSLERLYDLLNRDSSRCSIYKHHLRLEPDSLSVLSKLLKLLEQIEAFEEMVQLCLRFLSENEGRLSVSQEISVRLTLCNIYEQRLMMMNEANENLARAMELAPNDPRVLMEELDRCRKRGMKREQIELRKALIEVLPKEEVVDQIQALIQVYEDLNTPVDEIITMLQQAQQRVPESRQILLELRRYLRKEKRYFELAVVLEKLVPLTKDITSRKSILFEASEAHQHLGNEKLAEALYCEAQMLSPINPERKSEFVPPFVPLPSENRKRHSQRAQSRGEAGREHFSFERGRSLDGYVLGMGETDFQSLSSMVITSHSLSIVSDIEAEAGQSEEFMNVSSGGHEIVAESAGISDGEDETLSERDNSAEGTHEMPIHIDEDRPLSEQIAEARKSGDTKLLLHCLIRSQEGLDEAACEPRVLQEIGCIYLYEFYDDENARPWLERASKLSEEVAKGEQTLNALEKIYEDLQEYEQLARIYKLKIESPTLDSDVRKYNILLAELCYDHLNQKAHAIEILEGLRGSAPQNETVLKLLAQMYMDGQDYGHALERLHDITPLLVQNSRAMAQHILCLISIYTERNDIQNAKRLLRELLDHNDYIDKLAVIEQYKRICRLHDDWEDLLDVLKDEFCFYLQINRRDLSMDLFKDVENAEIPIGYAYHPLREYADILYYKFSNIDEAVRLYQTLAQMHPEDDYAVKTLFEIANAHPESESVLRALIAAQYPSSEAGEAGDNTDPENNVIMDGEHEGGFAARGAFARIERAHLKYMSGQKQEAREELAALEGELDNTKRARDIQETIDVFRRFWACRDGEGVSKARVVREEEADEAAAEGKADEVEGVVTGREGTVCDGEAGACEAVVTADEAVSEGEVCDGTAEEGVEEGRVSDEAHILNDSENDSEEGR